MDENSLIKTLSSVYAPSGKENAIFDLITKELQDYVDDIFVHEKSNSLICYKKGLGKCSLMLEAHVDEVFMVVTDILKEGFLKFYSNSIDPKILPGSKVVVHGKKPITGVIGIKPYHLVKKGEENKPYNFDNLYVDCGLDFDELKNNVSVGDYITFTSDFERVGNYFVNKSLDNRLGTYVVIEIFRRLKKIMHDVNIYGVFASQEEFTSLGAITSTFSILPDLAIVFDVTFAMQNEVSSDDGFELGSGPAIYVGVSGNRDIVNELIETAKKFGIPFNREVGILSHTDADKIELVRSGIPVALISIPVRYMHTPNEMFDLTDVERTVDLVKIFIEHYNKLGDLNGEY
ncbi:MAG: hypothetical protein K6343_00985 [Caldisericaceae bacterium]